MRNHQGLRYGFQGGTEFGASLIEVLVSIVIASIGLLALAGVNAASIRYTKMSQYRATATQLANDIGERLRANKGVPAVAANPGPPAVAAIAATGFFAGDYNLGLDFLEQATKATLPAQLCNTSASNCSTAEIAALDLAQWRMLVRDQLPEGSAVLKPAPDVGVNAMDVWVVWRDPGVAADDAPALTSECPNSLNRGDDPDPLSIRCSYFRINL